MTEEWRPIPSYPEYEASSLGRIRHMRKTRLTPAGFILSASTRPNGYLRVCVRKRSCSVHRLVCEAFNGVASQPRLVAAHKNGVRTDNHPTNLVWATYSENNGAHRVLQGTQLFGERVHNAKLTDSAVREIRAAYAAGTAKQTELAARFGVRQTKISNAINRKTWRHVE